ncbi:cell division cycle-associated protein 2 [Sylvia atricapilla]|uniref:cell division cycle-associated protein 2 n=1 Tax=Sylvia atricapilla TaxID=48155 RepID=UPI00339AB164
MLRGSKNPLKDKENESGCPEQKEEPFFTPSRDQKSFKVTKSKPIRPSKKENFSDGNQTRAPKCALQCPKGPEEILGSPQGCDGSWQLPQSCFGGLSEPPLPWHTEEDFSSNDFSTPERDKVEGKADLGLCEQRKKPVDFAAVINAELGMAQESFGRRPTGTSPNSRKFRRRSTIGLRGSPENNTLIRYLAQQRSSRQKETFTQISPFKPANVRPLKDKIDAFQGSFESLQEAEGETGLPHLGELSQEKGSSQNKSPFKKQPNLQHWSENFTLGNRGAALKGNLSGNGTRRSRNELRICSILSPHRVGIVPDPATAKEWISEQQNPVKSLGAVVTGDTLEPGHVARFAQGDAVSELSPRKTGPMEDLSLGMLGGTQTPRTPLGPGNNLPSCDLSQSSSLLRSILKKTPGMELRDSLKEYPSSAIDRGGGESAAVSNRVKAFETLQTETSDTQSSKTPKKKKVTFGEDLSPEIFDQNLPANTPLRRGASPGCPQGQSPRAGPHLSEEPLPLLDFGWDEEGVEPLPEFLEDAVASEAPPPAENAEAAESDKPDMITTRSTKRKQCRAQAEGTAQGSSGDTNTENSKETKNPKRSKIQRQRNPSSTVPKKTQKTKYPVYGKRRKKKVKEPLYGERETASRKPLLSPIPEIPEVFSSMASPNSPKADTLFTEDAALGDARPGVSPLQAAGTSVTGLLEEAAAPCPGDPQGPPRGLDSAAEFSNVVPDAEDTSEYFQQGEDTPCERETKESSSLTEKEDLQGNFLTGLEILEQQDLQEATQRTKCPQKASVRGDPARRKRRSSQTFCFPPVENLEVEVADVPVSFYNVEEVLSAPQGRGREEGSLQGCSRSSRASAELRVRRSMRLSRDSLTQGLAWVQLPEEIPKQPPLAAAPKAARRSRSTSILAGTENVQVRKQNLLPLPAPGKENEGSAALPAAPGRGCRRRSLLEEITS